MRFLLWIIPAASGATVAISPIHCRELERLADRVTDLQKQQDYLNLRTRMTAADLKEIASKLQSISERLSECSTDSEYSTPQKSQEELIIESGLRDGRIEWNDWPLDTLPSVPDKFIIEAQNDYRQLGFRIKLSAIELVIEDSIHVASAPYLLYDSEVLPDMSRIELVRHPLVARNADVTVFRVKDQNLIIKYQCNCRSLDESIMDLERDYIFLRKVEHLNVSPIPMFLSPPVKLPSFRTRKTDFDMTDSEYSTCAADPRSYVRYMVMERAGFTVMRYIENAGKLSNRNRFKLAIIMAIDEMRNLEKLHAMNVVHGDIHPGNLVRLAGVSFGLIDFGKAFFESDIRSDVDSFDIHCYLSHWNLQGIRFGFRDDVYKTLLAAAFLADPAVFERCTSLAKSKTNLTALIAMHADENLFDSGHSTFFNDTFPKLRKRELIRHHLLQALVLARSVVSVADKPDYTTIIDNLRLALHHMY